MKVSLEQVLEGDNSLMERIDWMVTNKDRPGMEYLINIHDLNENQKSFVREYYNNHARKE